MKKLFTIGFTASFIAVSIVACTKNNSVNPTSSKKNLTTFIKRDTVTPPHSSIALRDTVTPPARSLNALSTLIKRDTVTPPRSLVKRDTVTPPHTAIAIRDTVTPPRKP